MKSNDDRMKALMKGHEPEPETQEPKSKKSPRGAAKPVAPPAAAPVAKVGLRRPTSVPSASPAVAVKPGAARFGTARTTEVGAPPVPSGGGRMDAWSYSRLSDWETCPLKAKYKHVLRMKEPGSAAMQRGSMIHKLAQDYAEKTLKVLPPELKAFENDFKNLRALNPRCEEQWAFKSDWSITGWFDRPWLRVKTDAMIIGKDQTTGSIIDHKTGKMKDEHQDQLSLYAVSSFARYPKLESLSSELWYLDEGKKTALDFERGQFKELKEFWVDRVRPMMEDTRFPAKPNRLCQWCHFRKENGGPCKW